MYSLTPDSYIISFQRHIFSFLEEQAQAFMSDQLNQLIRYRHWDTQPWAHTGHKTVTAGGEVGAKGNEHNMEEPGIGCVYTHFAVEVNCKYH